jgi:hypothetical protein
MIFHAPTYGFLAIHVDGKLWLIQKPDSFILQDSYAQFTGQSLTATLYGLVTNGSKVGTNSGFYVEMTPASSIQPRSGVSRRRRKLKQWIERRKRKKENRRKKWRKLKYREKKEKWNKKEMNDDRNEETNKGKQGKKGKRGKFSLWLTNYALCHEGIWGSGCIDLRFLWPRH